MKMLGIVGGIGPESTIEYYRQLVAGFRRRISDGSYPPLLIDNIDLNRLLGLAAAPQRRDLVGYLLESISRLARAGADFALMAANTPHLVFDEVDAVAPIPLVSIVQSTCDFANSHGLRRLGLFGTRVTMQAGFYEEVFQRKELAIVLPDPDEQAYIHGKYVQELVNGVFSPGTRQDLQHIARELRERAHIDGLIPGGTELPLLLHDDGEIGIPLLDTTRIHVNAALETMLTSSI